MATTYKVLAQSNPAATTATDIYTVPAATQAVLSTLVVANQATAAATYRVSIRVAGAASAAKQFIAYDVTVQANDSTAITIGATLGAGDVVTVYGSSASLSFNLFGSEVA